MPTKKKEKLIPAVTQTNEAELQEMTDQALAIKNDVGWDLPVKRNKLLAGAELDNWIDDKENQSNITKVELGFAYAAKKRELGQGLFTSWIKETGRCPRNVRQASQVAQLIHSLSDTNRRRASAMPQRKLAVLASTTPEIVNDLLDNNEVTEDMSREQIREIIDLNKKVATLGQRLDTAELKNNDLKNKLKNKASASDYPDFVESTRHESTTLMNKAGLCFDDMEKLYQALEDLGRKGKVEHVRNWNIAATSLYHNLRGTIARAQTLLMTLDNSLPDDVKGPVSPAYYFKEEEVIAAVQERELLVDQHSHEAKWRKIERDSKKPKGKGRPAKV